MSARRGAKTNLARYLRKNPTYAEAQVWKVLRLQKELHFRRQSPVGPFILDFYCARHKIGIELDGRVHSAEEDAVRDKMLMEMGVTILRYLNDAYDPERIVLDVLKLIS